MTSVSVRYIVDDVAEAAAFYCRHLGFATQINAAPGFAALTRGDLRLLLSCSVGAGGGSQAMPDGTRPVPGGWNRISLEVTDLEAEVARLRGSELRFRNEVVTGIGGSQILLEDPSGNLVELFQPAG